MQLARKAASSSTPLLRRVDGPTRTVLLDTFGAASLTKLRAALELRDRIEVWVNEGDAGGEAN